MNCNYIDEKNELTKKMLETNGLLLAEVQQVLVEGIGKERCKEIDDKVETVMSDAFDKFDEATEDNLEMMLCAVSMAINSIITLHSWHSMMKLAKEIDSIEKGE